MNNISKERNKETMSRLLWICVFTVPAFD